MALNFDELRKKLTETKERGNGGGDIKYWKPKDGRNVIRILPAADRGNGFYAEGKVRYNVGPNKRKARVPLDQDEKCPIKDFVSALYATKDEADKKLAKKMGVRTNYAFNVIDRSVEEGQEGYGEVLLYNANASVFEGVLTILLDPDYGDFLDPEKGRDIIITKTGKDLETKYTVNARPKEEPIGIEDWEKNLHDLVKLTEPHSYEKREKLLSGEDDGDDDSSNDKKEESKEEKKQETKSTPPADKEEKKEEETEKPVDELEAEIEAMLKGKKTE
ncbi:DNA binding protein [Bacillus phage YungSlug]|nr:DNA binding protein [Bacillus phage YungSlug]